jgi:hypothetical protein
VLKIFKFHVDFITYKISIKYLYGNILAFLRNELLGFKERTKTKNNSFLYFSAFFFIVIFNILNTNTVSAQIQQRGSATSGTTSNTSLTINKPSGVVEGDLMIVNICQANSNNNPTLSGWTLIAGANQGNYRYTAIMYKVATASEGASYTFTLGTGTDAAVGSIIAFSGVDPSSPFDVATGTLSTGAGTTATATGITPITNNAAIVFIGGSFNTSWGGWSGTTPSFTEIMEFNDGGNLSVAAAWGILPTAGATGNKNVTLGENAYYGVMLLALREAISSPYAFSVPGASTFIVPEGVTCIQVEAWGGGGGGSTITNNNRRGGGGGGGAYAQSILTVIPNTNYTVQVGQGGNASSVGGSSTFSHANPVNAAGGSGGVNNNTGGGPGGTVASSSGDIRYAGGAGADGGGTWSGGGGGGAGSTGIGQDANNQTPGGETALYGGEGGAGRNTNGNGYDGYNFGGGGSGARRGNTGTTVGGAGAPGQIIITWIGLTKTNTPTVNSPIINGATTISGTSEANAAIIVYSNSSQIGTATADGSGVWSASVAARSTGQNISATAKLPGVCISDESGTVTVLPPTTITTGTISPLSFCPGSSVSVPYTITGTYNSGNVFTAQLSDASGSFASPTNIGTLTSTSSGTISANIPGGQAQGTGYRIRVVSNNPSVTGSNNGTNLSVAYPAFTVSPGSQCYYGDPLSFNIGASSALSGIFRWYSDSGGSNLLQQSPSAETSSTYGVTISSNQTYYVNFESGGCTSPLTAVEAYAIIPPSLTASAGGSFCANEPINLTSSGSFDNLYWEGKNENGDIIYYSTDQNPVIADATGMSGTYTVYTNTLSGVNLITNSDFEQGNTGFTSDYINSADLVPEGRYAIVANPQNVHASFISCGDHTTGSGLQMVINGATTPNVTIWRQTVNVVPNTYYQFTYWVQSVVGSNPSQLQLFVNGVQAGPTYTAVTATCNWTQFLYNWSSGSNTVALLELRNQNIVAGGNDFALDDIVFQHTCTAEASVEVYVADSFTPSVTISASNNPICSDENVTFTATPLHGGTSPAYQWRLNGSNVGSNSPTYTNSSLTNGDEVLCIMTSSISGCIVSGTNPATSNTLTITVNPLPTITTAGTIASVRYSTNSQTTTLSYTATTQSPTSYSIDWDATANAAGLTDQGTTAFAFAAGGGTLTGIEIPANVPDNITPYEGTMTITNANGCTATQAVSITVLPATIIDTHPEPLTLCEGGNGSFTVVSTEPTTDTYQWQYSTDLNSWIDTDLLVGISGHTSNELSITGALLAYNAYYFKCLVTEGAYTEESTPALLTVNPNAVITLSSAAGTDNQSICLGDAITNITYDITGGGTGAGASGLPAGVTGNYSGGTFTISGTPSAYGEFDYTVTTTGTCQQASAYGTITINSPYVVVTSDFDEECPDLIGTQGFQPNNTGYDAGATLVTFTITLNATTSLDWEFDYIIEDATVRLGTEPGGYASPNPQSGDNIGVTGSSTPLTFYINNVPGSQLLPVLKINRVNDGSCENSTVQTHADPVIIKAMPVVGPFD